MKQTALPDNSSGRGLASPLGITCVAFLIRVAYLFTAPGGLHVVTVAAPPTLGLEAINIAQSIAAHQGFSSPFLGASGPTGPTAWLTPLFPYLLSIPIWLLGAQHLSAWVAVWVLNEGISALTCWPVFHLGKQLAGPRFGALAAWLWALFPVAIWEPYAAIWYTTLSALLIALLLWITLCIRHSQSAIAWVGYGCLWGVELLTNASFASILPFVFLWLAHQQYVSKRAGIRFPLLAGLAVILTCAPWMVRNYIALHAVVPLRSNFGLELWRFNGGEGAHPASSAAELHQYVQWGEIAYMQAKKRAALAYIPAHLHQFADATRWRIEFFWIVGWRGNSRIFALSNMALAALLPVGFYCLYRRRREEFWLFLLFPLIFPLVYYVTLASILYRHAIDPVLIVIAAFPLYCRLNRAAGRKDFTHLAVESNTARVVD